MTQIPASVHKIVEKLTIKYSSDPNEAINQAMEQIQNLPDYKEFVDALVRAAIQGLVYDHRHETNREMKRSLGHYGGPAKVKSSASAAVQRVAESCYNYRVGGMVLGSLKGEALAGLIKVEEASADGHHFNANLLRRLRDLVDADKTVRECVSERTLKSLFKEVRKSAA